MDNSTILGKFKTVKALKDAYDSLQKEFTKKCQKLSVLALQVKDNGELQEDVGTTETSTLKDCDNPPLTSTTLAVDKEEEFSPVVTALPQELPKTEPTFGACNPDGSNKTDAPNVEDSVCLTIDENFAEKYLLNNPQFMELLLSKYLKQISTPSAPRLIGGSGTFSLTPQAKPVSIQEAGALASRLFDK